MKTHLLLVVGCMLLLFACRDNSTGPRPNPPVVPELSPLEKSVVSSGNSFGFRLFVNINGSEQNKNIFISPFSVSMALGMALNGAEGATLDSMKQVLGQSGLTLEEIDNSYQSISSLLVNLDPNVTMSIANSVWSRRGFPILQEFLDDCKMYFDAEAASLDFSSPDAVATINGWVNAKTNGKIPTILQSIPSDMMLYLINAIYFKGTWTYQFDPKYTGDTTFSSPTGDIPCKMMFQHAKYAYRATSEEQIIDLPYGAGLFRMTVILPTEGISVDQYAADLTQQKWDEMTSGLDSAEVDLFLPRFTLAYERTLNNDLMSLGMANAFSDGADFSRMSPVSLAISEVKHKTFVDVNEEGTEAAAVTSVGMRLTVAYPPPLIVRVDHPFIVAIREHATGTILFLGKIVAPAAS